MNPAIKAGQSAADIARNIAKQVAREPLEILKDAGNQITAPETLKPQENPINNRPQTEQKNPDADHLKDKAFAGRRMQALQNEINDIRKQGIFKDLQAKISAGEDVPLQDYPELSMEQKQVLKAQMEAVKTQQAQAKYQASVNEVPAVHSKPSRRFGAGQKKEAEKQQTRVEKPVPPSG